MCPHSYCDCEPLPTTIRKRRKMEQPQVQLSNCGITEKSVIIEPSHLAELLTHSYAGASRWRKFLIVDCRCFLDYNDSHIVSAVNAFYSKLVRRRLQENKLCASELLTQFLSCGVPSSTTQEAAATTATPDEATDVPDIILYEQQAPPSLDCSAEAKRTLTPTAGAPTPAKLCLNTTSGPRRKLSLGGGGRRRASSKGASSLSTSEGSYSGELFAESESFITLLVDKLQSSPQFRRIMTLKGGFLDFQAKYPELCEGLASRGGGDKQQRAAGDPPAVVGSPRTQSRMSLTSLSQPCLPVSNHGPTKILPFLYLGSQQDAMDQQLLGKYDISRVVNLSISCPRPEHLRDDRSFLRIPVNDSYQEKLLPYFDEAFAFIDNVRASNQSVLVHCLAGISRSPTLAIAYIMRHLHMTSEEAYTYVKAKRPSISPNFNFMGQLLEYEREMKQKRGKLVAAQLRLSMRKVLVPTNNSPSLLVAKGAGSNLSPHDGGPKTSPIVGGITENNGVVPALFTFDGDATALSDTEAATTVMDTTEAMRRSLSCPLKIQKSSSSAELSRGWREFDSQSPSSVTNVNGKRQMCSIVEPPPADVQRPELILSVPTAVPPQQPPTNDTTDDDVRMLATVSWPKSVERPRGLCGLKSRRALNIPKVVKEDLPSPSTELSKLSFASPLSCCVGGTLPESPSAKTKQVTNQHKVQMPASVCATNPFFNVFSAASERTSLDSIGRSSSTDSGTTLTCDGADVGARRSFRLSTSSSTSSGDQALVSPSNTTTSSTSGIVSQSCSSAESMSDDRPPMKVVIIQPQSSVDSVPPNSAENPLFTPATRFRFHQQQRKFSKEPTTPTADDIDVCAPKAVPTTSTNLSFSQRLGQLLKRAANPSAAMPFVVGFSSMDSGRSSGFFPNYFSRRSATKSNDMTRSATTNTFDFPPKMTPPPNTTTVTAQHETEVFAAEAPVKSQSESAMLYSLCDDLDSPESGFVESPLRDSLTESSSTTASAAIGAGSFHTRDPERESISSASSIEIAVS